jgi:NADH-quinone oxidoreductase subunit M
MMAPLIVMTLLLGVYPALVTDLIGPSVENLLTHYHAAVGTDMVTETVSHAANAASH